MTPAITGMDSSIRRGPGKILPYRYYAIPVFILLLLGRLLISAAPTVLGYIATPGDAIAGILIRSDTKMLARADLARTLRQHRLKSPDGSDVIDTLIRLLQAT